MIDKCSSNPEKAIFYVRQTVENGWSRSMLLNLIDSGLFERQGKSLTYDLEKFYPEKVEGTMPTIEEIEAKLGENF